MLVLLKRLPGRAVYAGSPLDMSLRSVLQPETIAAVQSELARIGSISL